MKITEIFGSFLMHPGRTQQQIVNHARQLAGQAVTKIKAQLGYSHGYTGRSGWMLGGEKSPYGLSGTGAGINLNHSQIRQNARLACFDTVEARAIVERYADSVADVGLKIECVPVADLLGVSQDNAERWSEDVEQRFDLWAQSKEQHRSGTMTFYQAHHLYQIFQHRDGEVFVRLMYSRDRRLQNRLQWEFIDPNQIAGAAFTTTYLPGLHSEDGIERDERRRERAYKVYVQKPDGTFEEKKVQRVNPKTGRINMLHGFCPEFAGQGRGYSRLAHALQEFQKLTDFSLAHIQKAIIQSQINMFVKPSGDAGAVNPFEDMLTDRGAGPDMSNFGVNPDAVTDPTSSVDNVGFAVLPEAAFRHPGSVGVFNLESGEDLKPFDTKTPSATFDQFVDAFTAHLCASVSMPVEVLLMKFNANYSASRAALMMFWRVAVRWRQEMAADFLNPMFEMWLSEELAAGRIKAPGFSDPRLRAAWLNANWIGVPMPNIDPMRTAKADETYAGMGATDLDRIARNLNGSSGKSNRRRLARQYAELPESPFIKKAGNA